MAIDSKALKQIGKWVEPFRVTNGAKFRLKSIDPGDTLGIGDEHKPQAQQSLADGVRWLAEEQDKLYAQDRRSLLLVFQAMDAAGKDGTIKHVMRGVNPQGCQVVSFKQPSSEELDHDWMWRDWRALAGARSHRHLQPLVLRGGAGRPGASESSWRRRSCPSH